MKSYDVRDHYGETFGMTQQYQIENTPYITVTSSKFSNEMRYSQHTITL